MPGVPDLYQGTELWDLSFVDPDNRRPIDFAMRAGLLDGLDDNWGALSQEWTSGRIKFAWTRHLLGLRKQAADLFTYGDYRPIAVTGRDRAHVIAFARVHKDKAAMTIALRQFAALTDSGRHWPKFDSIDAQARLDESQFKIDTVAEETIEIGAMLSSVPAIVLLGEFAPSRFRDSPMAEKGSPRPARQI
jgi:(1->4)-alpha-D-glucan 1-alpha-D-glucosylmutase